MKRHIARVWSWMAAHKVVVGLITAVLAWLIHGYVSQLPSDYEGKIADAEWTHTIIVERYQAWDRTGFREELPTGAFDVVSQGEKLHHTDTVPDGTRTEYYTVRESCGSIRSGRSYRTQYCNRERSRTVTKYRQVPQYAESVAYKRWEWGEQRRVTASGHGTTDLRWPDAEAKVGEGLTNEREMERDRRESRYVVNIEFDDRRELFEVPADAFGSYGIGTKHRVVVRHDPGGETVEVDNVPIVSLR